MHASGGRGESSEEGEGRHASGGGGVSRGGKHAWGCRSRKQGGRGLRWRGGTGQVWEEGVCGAYASDEQHRGDRAGDRGRNRCSWGRSIGAGRESKGGGPGGARRPGKAVRCPPEPTLKLTMISLLPRMPPRWLSWPLPTGFPWKDPIVITVLLSVAKVSCPANPSASCHLSPSAL